MKPSNQKHRRVFDTLQNQQKKREFTKRNVGSISLLRVGVFAVVFLLSGTMVGLGVFGAAPADATTGINQEMSFQGKIVTSTGQNIPDGTYNMQFRIYTGCTNEPTNNTGCTAVWTEDYLKNNSQGVTFTSGTYQINLGSICAFTTSTCQNNSNTAVDWNSYPLYLSLQIGNTSNCSPNNPGASNFQADCGGDGEMNPYVLLTSTPYAFNSNELGGHTASEFGQLAANNTWTGANTIQGSSSSMLQIQNSIGSSDLVVDTTGLSNAVTNPGFEGTSNTGWALKAGSGTVGISSSQAYSGSSSEQVALTSTAAGDGVKFTPTSLSATTYVLSFYIKQTAGTAFGTNLGVGYNNGSDQSCTLTPSLTAQPVPTTGWARYYCTMTMTGTPTYIYWKETDAPASARTFYLDDVQLEQTSNTAPNEFTESRLQLNGTVSSSLILQNASDSTTAFQIQNSAADSTQTNIFTADTLNGKAIFGNIVTNTTNVATQVLIQANANNRGIAIESNGTQDALDIYNSSGTNVLGVNSNGTILPGTNNSVSLGSTSLNFATANARAYNFDGTAAGNLQFGTAATTTGNALNITGQTAGSTANNGGAVTVKGGTATTTGTGGLLTLQGGATTSTGTDGGVTIDAGSGATTANGTISIGATNASTIGLGNTASGTQTTIQGGTTSTAIALTTGTNGSIALTANGTGTIGLYTNSATSGTLVKTLTNSTVGFQVQNTSGFAVATVDTSNGYLTVGTGSHVNGSLVLNNSTNNNTLQILSGATAANGGSGYSITMPTAGGTGTQCLQSTSGSTAAATTLQFGSCSGGSGIANQTTTQSANFNVQAATSGTVAGVLEANASGTGDILDLKNGSGTAVATIGYAGSTLIKTSTDSTAGFQVQDHSAHTLLTVDTTNQQTTAGQNSTSVIMPTFNVVQSGTGDATMALQTASGSSSAFYIGNDVSNSNAFTINSNYSATYAGSSTSFGYSAGTSTDSNGTMIQAGNFSAPISGNLTSITVDFANFGASSDKFSVALYADSSGVPGTLLGSSSLGFITLSNGAGNHNQDTLNLSSPVAVTSGTTYWLAFNTDNGNDFFWYKTSGTTSNCFYSVGSIADGTWASNPAQGSFGAGCAFNVTASITPTGSLTDTNTNDLFTLSQSGQLTLRNVTNSTTALQVQNASGYNVLGADTTDGWATLGTSSHVNGALTVYNSSNAFNVEILSGVTSANYTLALPTTGASASGQCLQSDTGSTTSATTLKFASCGGGSGINNQTTAQSANFYVQAATSGTVAGVLRANASGTGDVLDLLNGSGTAVATFGSAGAALFENSTNSATAFQIQNSSGTSFFTADTTKDLITTNQLNIGSVSSVGSSGRLFSDAFGSGNAAAWSGTGGSGTITYDTSTVYSGKYSLKAVTSANGAYAQATIASSSTVYARTYFDVTTLGNPTVLLDLGSAAVGSGTHLYVYLGASGNLCYNYNAGAATACSATAPSTSNWHKLEVRYVAGTGANGVLQVFLDNVQVVTNSNAINISNGAWTLSETNVAIGNNTSSTATVYYDSIAVDTVATGDASGLNVADSLHVSGTTTFGNGVIVRPANNTTTAFQIQNASGGNEISVDTTNDRVIIGTGSTGESTAKILVLDSGTSVGDPTGVAGAMYYNSNLGKFRCYQGGFWQNCAGLDGDGLVQAGLMQDEFLANGTSAGTTPWTCAAIASGTFPAASLVAGHVGVDTITSSTSANSGFQCSSGAIYSLGGGETFEMLIDPLTFTNTTARLGFSTATWSASIPASGCYINITSAPLVSGQCKNAGTTTTGTTYGSAATGTWYLAKIQFNSNATGVTFSLYNATTGSLLWSDSSVTSNLPTAAVVTGFESVNSGTSATALDNVDAIGSYYTGYR